MVGQQPSKFLITQVHH